MDNVSAALNLAERIESDLATLASFPDLGRIPRDADLREARYRYLIIGKYLVFYTVEKRTVIVHRIFHRARDYKERKRSLLPSGTTRAANVCKELL